ncbi:MAG TPA: hypothetical protein EYG90_05840 [Campylobacterales bacterium]|nr:hypothetical protein [Campylobacterales bacterium]
MNTISTDFQFFIEYDSNPFVLFNAGGKIIYLNSSAELLMGSCSRKELFEITLSYAPKTLGYKKTLIDLSFGFFEFYSINVLYNNDDEIAIHLYNKPMVKINKNVNLDGYTLTDLNLLFEANIELFKMQYSGKITLFTDYDLPKFQVHQNNFSFLLRLLLEQLKDSEKIEILIKMKVGEIIVVDKKRYPIVILEIKTNRRNQSNDTEIKEIAMKNYINAHFQVKSMVLEIPALF